MTLRRLSTLIAVLCSLPVVVTVGCSSESREPKSSSAKPTGSKESSEPWFDVVTDSGLDFVLRSGAKPGRCYLPEIVCGGVGLLDYDGDGWLDVYLVQGGALASDGTKESNRLFRNLGGMKFEDVTESAGLLEDAYGMGCAIGDYDGDGDPDILVTNVGANSLWRNDGGRFTEVAGESGVDDPSFGASAAFADYDGDGDLDLFVVNYVRWTLSGEITCRDADGLPGYCQPNNYQAPAPDRLYRNEGSGRFTNVTRSAGLDQAFGTGLGVVSGDFDGDGLLDFFVANDGMSNQLWLQTEPGRFQDKAAARGVAVNASGKTEAGMGVVTFDFGLDGDLDLFLSHLSQETNTFYENQGTYFEDSTDVLGLGMSSKSDTGFGIGLIDFDLDGRLDLYVANGRVQRPGVPTQTTDPYAQPNLLYAGRDGRFERMDPAGGTKESIVLTSRGAAFGDLDGDTDIDAVIQNRDASITLLVNRWATQGRRGILLDLRHDDGRLAVGAAARIRRGDAWSAWHVCDPASGYLSSQDPRVHFGLLEARDAAELQVRWRDGSIRTYGPLTAGIHKLTPSQGR